MVFVSVMAASSASAWGKLLTLEGSRRSSLVALSSAALARAPFLRGKNHATSSSRRGRSCTANAKRTETAETGGTSGIDARPSWVKPASRLHVTRAEQHLPGKHKPVRCADRTSACGAGSLRRKSGGERVAHVLDVRADSRR